MNKNLYKKMNEQLCVDPSLMESMIQNMHQQKPPLKHANRSYLLVASLFVAALCLGLFLTNPVVAAQLEEIPMIGSFFSVFTKEEYTKEEDFYSLQVEVPTIIETSESSKSPTITDINATIEEQIALYTSEAHERIEEYAQAYLETGGTAEEFDAKEITVDVTYTILCDSEEYLSLLLFLYESWNGNYAVYNYVNLDKATGKEVSLEELLGSNYIEVVNNVVRTEIQSANSTEEYPPYFEGDMGFQTITEDTSFYLNSDNLPVVVFAKYEVAPGAYGRPEFIIHP